MTKARRGGFVAASRHLAAVESLTAFVGRQRPLPEWADKGAIIGLQGGTEHVRAITEQLQQAGVPIAALWLQDWTGSRKTIFGQRLWWNWELDDSYKDWRELREQLSAVKGAAGPIRLLRYVNPMFSNVLVAGKNTTSPQFQIAMAESFLVVQSEPAAENTPHLVKVAGFDAALLDLTNPRAREWMRDEVLRSEVLGDRALGSNSNGGSGSGGASSLTMSDGWMADFGEAIPCHGVRLHDGTPPCAHHNEFPVEWARLNVDAARRAGAEKDVLIFLRSGFTTSPRVAPLFWLGDQLHTWDEHDGIASTVTATLSGVWWFCADPQRRWRLQWLCCGSRSSSLARALLGRGSCSRGGSNFAPSPARSSVPRGTHPGVQPPGVVRPRVHPAFPPFCSHLRGLPPVPAPAHARGCVARLADRTPSCPALPDGC